MTSSRNTWMKKASEERTEERHTGLYSMHGKKVNHEQNE
jgi:hypothetical protein